MGCVTKHTSQGGSASAATTVNNAAYCSMMDEVTKNFFSRLVEGGRPDWPYRMLDEVCSDLKQKYVHFDCTGDNNPHDDSPVHSVKVPAGASSQTYVSCLTDPPPSNPTSTQHRNLFFEENKDGEIDDDLPKGFDPTDDSSPTTQACLQRMGVLNHLPGNCCASGQDCLMLLEQLHPTMHVCPMCQKPLHGSRCGEENWDTNAKSNEKTICYPCSEKIDNFSPLKINEQNGKAMQSVTSFCNI